MRIVGIPSLRALLFSLLGLVLPFAAFAQVPSITVPPANQSAASGDSASLSVSAAGAAPLSYQWRWFGTNLAGATNSSLLLTNVSFTQGGVYAVLVTNSLGSVTSAPALLAVDENLTFRILQMSTNGALAIEHNTVTGDDRGGLVVSPSQVFVTGDGASGRFSATDFSGGTSLGLVWDSLCGNLHTEQIYVLGEGTNIVGYGGSFAVNSLIELDGLTGLPNGTRITLSTNIPFSNFGVGVFSGYDRIVLWDGYYAYDILLPSGRVTFLGPVPNLSHTSSESWAFWGLAEYHGNSVHLDYVGDFQHIHRLRAAQDATPGILQTFANLADMASIGFSASRSRWYFHHEGTSQFRSGDETVGSAKAVYNRDLGYPTIYQDPESQTVYPDATVFMSVVATGSGSLSYRWRFNGVNIPGATQSTLRLTNVQPSASGLYSVVVSNALGAAVSGDGNLFVIGAPQILADPQPRSVLAGTNTVFEVQVQAAPPVYYYWRRNGADLPNGTNAAFSIPAVTGEDAGYYSVLVSNRFGQALSAEAQLVILVESPFNFKILGLSNDAVIVEHLAITGDDRGGIAVSSNRVMVTGDGATGGFAASDLSGGTTLPFWHNGLVCDLRSEKIFVLGDGDTVLGSGGGWVSSLIEINELTGAPTTNRVNLSQPVYLSYGSGLFAGYGQVVVHDGGHAYSIAVPSGVVADLGPMNSFGHAGTENWAYWGLAENFGGTFYLVYPQDSYSIVRTRVPDGLTTSIANFLNLSDMASISASVRRGRWYFHYQGGSEFGGTNESIGYASALFSVVANPVIDHYAWEPLPGAVFTGVPFDVVVTARTIDDIIVTNFSGVVGLGGFATADGQPVSLSPADSGNFVNGGWTGQVVVATAVARAVLRASDVAGRFGMSGALAVVATNDLSVGVVPSTNAATLYAALTYNVFLTNTGPGASTAVFATNVLPGNVNFISATASQGGCVLGGGTVVCDVGLLAAASGVDIVITVVPNGLGALTNFTRVVRAEGEEQLGNNVVTTVVPVALPVITVTDSVVVEGNGSTNRGTNVFFVSLNTTSGVPVSVQYATVPGTASNTVDYVQRSGTLTFAPGVTQTNIRVTVVTDRAYELDEYYFVNFSNAVGATLERTQAVGTVLNDDELPELVVTNAFITEGNAGSAVLNIPVRLSVGAGVPLSISFATSNGTAVAGSDYGAQSGSLTFPSGGTNLTISLSINGDTVGEADEYFYVNFFGGVNWNASTQIVVTILNNDPLTNLDHFAWSGVGATQGLNVPFGVGVEARDVLDRVLTNYGGGLRFTSGAEGTGAEHLLPPTESLNSFAGGPYTIGFDFTPSVDVWVTQVRHYSGVNVSIWSDTGSRLVSQAVSSLDGVWRDTALPAAVKLNAGTRYRVSGFNGVDTKLWYFGNGLPTTFKHGTIGNSYYNVGDVFPTIDLGSALYLVDLDYVVSLFAFSIAPTNGVMTNGVWSGAMRVLTPGTNVQLTVSDGSNVVNTASSAFEVVGVEDLELSVRAGANPAAAGESVVWSLVVSNTGPSAATGVWVTNQIPAGAAYLGATTDHGSVGLSGGAVVANVGSLAGQEAAVISIAWQPAGAGVLTNVAWAGRAEPEVYLGNNRRTNVVSVVALGLSVADVAVREGPGGTTNAVFVVTLSAVSTQVVSVAFATAGGSAVAPEDFASVAGVLVFAPGVTNLSVPVAVAGDLLNEFDETFFLNLTNATNAAIARSPGVGTIINDDPLPMLSVSDVSVVEGHSGLTPATFIVRLSQPSGKTVFFNASTIDIDAEAGVDYVGTNVVVAIDPGQTSVPVTVLVLGDGLLEPDEKFLLLLSNPSSATIATAEARATILNDDLGAGFLDHFAWSIIPSPQTLGRIVNVSLTARDGTDALVPFNGPLALTARSGTNAVTLTPTNTAAFVNGFWNGILTFSSSGTNVIVTADDGAGHLGDSNPFDVNVANLVLSGAAPPEVLIEFPYDFVLAISNAGPSTATAVLVTNVLPPDVSFSGVAPSAGSCSYTNGTVRCDLGALTNGGTASVSIFLTPWRGGPLSNVASVAAFEFDPFADNNRSTNLVQVTGDIDHDGLPDSWEAQHGLSSGNPNDANFDLDHDGQTSLQEYIAGTDPNLAASVFKAELRVQGAGVAVRFATVLDRLYLVERSPAPEGPWTPVGAELFGDGDEAIVTDPIPAGMAQHFYRVRVRR